MVGGVSAKLGINLTVHFIWNKSTEKLLYQFRQTWFANCILPSQPSPPQSGLCFLDENKDLINCDW